MNQEEIDQLIRLAGGEDQAVRDLEEAVGQLRAVRDAMVKLQQLPAEQLRDAIRTRSRILAGTTAQP